MNHLQNNNQIDCKALTAEKEIPRNISSLEEGPRGGEDDKDVSSVQDVDISDGGKLFFN